MATIHEMQESKQQTRLRSDALKTQARMAKPEPENLWVKLQERKAALKAAEDARQSRVKEFMEKRSHTYDNAVKLDNNLLDAAQRGNRAEVIELLDLGADPLIKDELGMSAYKVALYGSHPDVASLILARARELYHPHKIFQSSKPY